MALTVIDPVAGRLRYYRVVSLIQYAALVTAVGYGLVTKNGVPAVFAFLLQFFNLTKQQISPDTYGERHLCGKAEVKALRKALKRSEEGKKLDVKWCKVSHGVKSERGLLEVSRFGGFLLLMTPKSYWVQNPFSVARGRTENLEIDTSYRDVARERPRWRAEIVGETWHHATKNGDRDYRFKNNYTIPIVREHLALVKLPTGEKMSFCCRTYEEANSICLALLGVLQGTEYGPAVKRPAKLPPDRRPMLTP